MAQLNFYPRLRNKIIAKMKSIAKKFKRKPTTDSSTLPPETPPETRPTVTGSYVNPLPNVVVIPDEPHPEDIRISSNDVSIDRTTQSKSLWSSENTPKWNEAVKKWSGDNQEDYETLVNFVGNKSSEPVCFELAEYTSREVSARIKRWLPVISGIRGLAMTFANLDPYKIAPLVCSSVFFAIDIVFNSMNPEDRDKILNIIFECGNTINEGVSMEANFPRKHHPVIQNDISEMESDLFDQYLRVLKLMSDITRQCTRSQENYTSLAKEVKETVAIRGRQIWSKLSNQIMLWETKLNTISKKRTAFALKRKNCEDKLARDKYIKDVLDWIEEDNDPQPTLKSIKEKVMPNDRYKNAGMWLLESEEFKTWRLPFTSQGLEQNLEQDPSVNGTQKRVFWIKGSYGTGKTTLMYQVYSKLKDEPEFHLGSCGLRVVRYFCDAKDLKKRPQGKTIIRSLASRLSLQPDFSLSKTADSKYNELNSSGNRDQDMDMNDWINLFHELLNECPGRFNYVFVIDALDECEEQSVGNFLDFMRSIIKKFPNVYLLCSSHQQIPVYRYFDETILHELEVTRESTYEDMELFISGELENRKQSCEESIFYKTGQEGLLRELKSILSTHACGMFQWVRIWLNIFLPPHHLLESIEHPEVAREYLEELKSNAKTHNRQEDQAYKKLEDGYQHLWDWNSLRGQYFKELRIRLFHVILASMENLSLDELREALRINGDKYDESLSSKDVERLYSNFLETDEDGFLRFSHYSARIFVLHVAHEPEPGTMEDDPQEFSMRRNHLSMIKLYINLIGNQKHPFWEKLQVIPSNWTDVESDRLHQDLERWASWDSPGFHRYLTKYGLQHCDKVAERRSIFDPDWINVLDQVVLSPDSAFGFSMIAELYDDGELHNGDDIPFLSVHSGRVGGCTMREHDGHLEVLYSHVLAQLDLINEQDLQRIRSGFSSTESSGDDPHVIRQKLLFKHISCVGNSFSYWKNNIENRENDGATALQIACVRRNPVAVDVILQAVHNLSDYPADENFLTYSGRYGSPICITTTCSRKDHVMSHRIASLLLNFEKTWRPTISNGPHLSHDHVTFSSEQWNLYAQHDTRMVLFHVMIALEESEICDLLGISKPSEFNCRCREGNTVLHLAATNGFTKLFKKLVEEHGVDINAQNHKGLTPYFYASYHRHTELVHYIRSRTAGVPCDPDISNKYKFSVRDLGFLNIGSVSMEDVARYKRAERCVNPTYPMVSRRPVSLVRLLESIEEDWTFET
ncbi:hypothetical protein F4805DRAFT_74695 [Annulohypoxylon moriforme]|nr:hypothetical protein F4805DRAFT_74695 [Annulohypoxylon moriforme]